MKSLLVEVCIGTSCHLLGAQDLLQAIEEFVPENQAKLDIRGVTCLKTCGRGPNVRIDGQVFTNVTPDYLIAVIQSYLLQEEELLCPK